MQVPFAALRLEYVERLRDAFLARPTDRKFHNHDRQSQQRQEQQIQQHKGCAAVLAGDIRKTPDIAQTDRTACGNQKKTKPGRKFFPLHAATLLKTDDGYNVTRFLPATQGKPHGNFPGGFLLQGKPAIRRHTKG